MACCIGPGDGVGVTAPLGPRGGGGWCCVDAESRRDPTPPGGTDDRAPSHPKLGPPSMPTWLMSTTPVGVATGTSNGTGAEGPLRSGVWCNATASSSCSSSGDGGTCA